MSQTYKPYPAYKDSGVEWLGKVPVGWEVRRLRFLLTESLKYGANESAELDDPHLPRYIRITDISETGSLHRETFRSLPEAIAAPYLLQEGDILFARSGATAGKTFLYHPDWGTCAYAGYLIRARLDRTLILPQLVRYYTASLSYWSWLESIYVQATIQNVSAERYNELLLPLPPLPEQQAIANFLDEKTARIDRLIQKKRKLIEKLKEKRAALISRTVTRGLPAEEARAAGLEPHTRFKPSGVEWLGKVPVGWEVTSLKWYFQCYSGDFLASERVSVECSPTFSIPVIGGNGIMGHTVRSNIQTEVIVVGRVGALCGNVHLIRKPAWITDNALVLDLLDKQKFCLEFLSMVLHCRNLNEIATKTAQPLITGSQVGAQRVPAPPLPEQQAIANFLDRETEKIDRLVAKVEEGIERLGEYRAGLITAAVTGKIDVRKVQA